MVDTVTLYDPDLAVGSKLERVLTLVGSERLRQERKCAAMLAEGLRWHSCDSDGLTDHEKLAVLVEEVGEVAKECCDARAAGELSDEARSRLRGELIQTAVVAVAWIEALT